MKITTWIKYEEVYTPPRCRKPRYKNCEEFVTTTISEAKFEDLKLAFEDNSYDGQKIYSYKASLWRKAKTGDVFIYGKDPLESLIYSRTHSSKFFPREWRDGEHPGRAKMLSAVRKDNRNYLLVDSVLYVRADEPRYCVYTFGLGHNHGGTSLLVDYHYNSNIRKENYFSALQGDEAVAYANLVAKKRGDTNSIGKFKPLITVHMPELVKVEPNKQHGDGNKILNDMEEIIDSSSNALEAGLLCMLLAGE